MSKSNRPEIEEFHRQMETCRSIVTRNKDLLEEDIWLEKQITFWTESTRFLITELEIWDQHGNSDKYQLTITKLQKSLDRLHELIRQLT